MSMKQQLVELGNGAHALATQILGNADDAADAVHDSFIKVLNKPDSYDVNSGPLKPWFLRVVRNRCIDLIRRRRPVSTDATEIIDPDPSPEVKLEISQRNQELQTALSRLSGWQRQILILRDYMDLSYTEIAAVQEIAQGTVMSRLHRARMALRKELIEDG